MRVQNLVAHGTAGGYHLGKSHQEGEKPGGPFYEGALMLKERVVEDIYVFTSEVYAQVTAGAIITPQGTVVIDTLLFPYETKELLDFLRHISRGGIRYVVNTHSHGDHIYGNYLFEEAEVVAHRLCRRYLQRYGKSDLAEAKAHFPELAEVRLRLPNIVFEEGELALHLGNKTMRLMHMPGHTADSIAIYVEEDKVLFAGDAVMPLPYIVGGDLRKAVESLRAIGRMSLESIVQGHGEILLRGEIGPTIESNILYLETIYEKVRKKVAAGAPWREVERIDIESCGKSRIPLGGLVRELHRANLRFLYDSLQRGELI